MDSNIADVALSGAKTAEPAPRKYLPGSYRSDKYMRIIKELKFVHSTDSGGKVQRTHGTWASANNFIVFHKGAETVLSKADLALPAVQRLIDTKTIYRVG